MKRFATCITAVMLTFCTLAASKDDAWAKELIERSQWWSLTPIKRVDPPRVNDPQWARGAVDRFIRARLTREGLNPAPPAKPEVLLRRLSFVLRGLPPTPEQLKRWRSDSDISKAVDELLASTQFGERFARHWMDVARYTDTYGYEWDNPAKGSWRYRDYLIRAFNADIGFDQLTREQIAGDLLRLPRINEKDQINESLIGPMFFHFGEHRHGDSLNFNGIHQEMVNNKVDAFSKAFLAMTVACARCHDHKLDAVSQKDYYALASVFMSARWTTRVVDTPDRNAATIAQLKSLRSKIRDELGTLWAKETKGFGRQIGSAFGQNPWRKALGQSTQTNKPPTPESIAYPIHKLLIENNETAIPDRWMTLKTEWEKEHNTRRAWNKEHFTVLSDFAKPGFPAGWVMEGDGLRHGYVSGGAPLVSLKGTNALERLLPRGYHTYALSSKLSGSLRTPHLAELKQNFYSVALAGGEWAGHLTPVENAFQTERIKFLPRKTKPAWHRFGTFLKNEGWNVRMEFATCDLNPNFPPRTGLALVPRIKLPDKDLGYDKRSWLSITGIVTHQEAPIPKDDLKQFAALYTADPPKTRRDAAMRLGDWLSGGLTRWANDKATEADVTIINWLLENRLLPAESSTSLKLNELVATYRKTEERIVHAAVVNSMDEREFAPVDYRLNVRGDVNQPGDPMPHDFLQVFAGRNQVAQSAGSGRLELAEFLVHPQNPLTARVYVNRVWHWIFGAGLVSTPNDFGQLGNLPSHPELLDYLATEFVRNGWSTKWLIRQLVMSQAFGQSGHLNQDAHEKDPDNRLLHHYPTRRLEAEAVRDSILAVSSRLDSALFGRPINPPRVREHSPKRLFSGPVDGNGRRSIYLRITMMELPDFLTSFNFPDPKLPNGKRDATNVPAQALMLLNDPFVTGQASHWAKQLLKDKHESIDARIQVMFNRALGRKPSTKELDRWTKAAREFSDAENVNEKTLLADEGLWTRMAHALFNTKEFIYYR